MKKLPIGIQTFSEVINENYCYVDKTRIIYELINNGKYFFLSRPRRFGKSLLIDTIQGLFEGRKELFKGLWIDDKWDFGKKYPVIKIDFGAGVFKEKVELNKRIHEILEVNQKELGVRCNFETTAGCFIELITKTAEKYNKSGCFSLTFGRFIAAATAFFKLSVSSSILISASRKNFLVSFIIITPVSNKT